MRAEGTRMGAKMQNYQEMMRDTFDEMTQIGAGGGGTIFKAHHKRLDKEVVLKKIHVSQLNNISHRAELDILKNLKHSYIPQMLDFIEYGEEVFTVMEYIPGKSFAQLLEEKRRFSQKDVVKWTRQLCEVVDYLHSQTPPIIHCDIKPANIMLTPAGDICLIDFNISGVKTEEGIAAIGYSSGYAPVEQFAVVAGRVENVMQTQRGGRAGSSMPESIAGKAEGRAAAGGDDRTEIMPSAGEDRTEIAAGAGEDRTEIAAGAEEDRTEITPNAEDNKTEGASSKYKNSVPSAALSASSDFTGSKSLLRFMTDEEWTAAKGVEASLGKKLMIDERTDIYSVGAALYHILTGQRPQPFYRNPVPVRQLCEDASEGLIFVIEKAMVVNPADRFRNSGQMLKAARNLGTVDRRYKSLSRRQLAAAVLTGILTVGSALSISQGRSVMAQEKQVQYSAYIEEMRSARIMKDYEGVNTNYVRALELFEGEPEAYYEMAAAYYDQRQYDRCIEYLSRNVYTNSAIMPDEGYGRFYYITASCYFELADYNAAASYYARAVELQPEEMSYYMDYVAALARNGQLEKAEAVLEEAERKGISSDVFSLLNGEIALLREDFRGCERYLTECIEETADDYVRLRAYTKLDDDYQLMYEGEDQYEVRRGKLAEALAVLPPEYQVTLMERLAQVYIDYSDVGDRDACCESAIALFVQMEDRGYATFTSRYNIAVLYEKMERYEEAQEQLDFMEGIYPDNYIIYKRRSFIELEMQAVKPNGERDYHAFQEVYQRALELYGQNEAGEDMEMLSLQQLYNDVAANGWLE